MSKGKFIVIEGPDYAGKSSLIAELNKILSEKQESAKLHHFPQEDHPIGKAIYHLLDNKRPIVHQRPDLFQHLYVADQYDAQQLLDQYREEFDYIICDRYMYSTLAFGMANGLSYEEIRSWQGGIQEPDLLIILHGDPNIFMARKRDKEKDAHEVTPFQVKVNECYNTVGHNIFTEGTHVVFLKADEPFEVVLANFKKIIAPLIE